MSDARSLRIVLLRPRRAENVGAIARAMKNCGLSDWVVVDAPDLDLEAARRVATQSHDVVDALRFAATLGEAVADASWVVGTSSRSMKGRRRFTPREWADDAAPRPGVVALVFGEESSGLSNDDLEQMHDLSTIPAAPEQPSLNLSQAALLYCYEYRLATMVPKPAGALPTPATDGELRAIGGRLEELLGDAQFLRGDDAVIEELVRPLQRARLSRTEARLWLAALGSIAKSKR